MTKKKVCQNCSNPCRKCRIKAVNQLCRSGMTACNEGRFDEAEAKLIEALDHAKEVKIKMFEAKVLNSLGITYAIQGMWDKALLHYEQAMLLVVNKTGPNNFLYDTVQKNLMQIPAASRQS